MTKEQPAVEEDPNRLWLHCWKSVHLPTSLELLIRVLSDVPTVGYVHHPTFEITEKGFVAYWQRRQH